MCCLGSHSVTSTTAIVDLVGRNGIFLSQCLADLSRGTKRLLSSLLHNSSYLFNYGNIILVCLFNRSVAGLGNWEMVSVDLI